MGEENAYLLPGETKESLKGPDWMGPSPYEGSLDPSHKILTILKVFYIGETLRMDSSVKAIALTIYRKFADSRPWDDEKASKDTWLLASPEAFGIAFKEVINTQLRMLERANNVSSTHVSSSYTPSQMPLG